MRFKTKDAPGVIGNVGSCFGQRNVSIQSIVQFNASDAGAEIVVITHEVSQRQMNEALDAIQALPECLAWPLTSAASRESYSPRERPPACVRVSRTFTAQA